VLKQNECVTFNWIVGNQFVLKQDDAAAVPRLNNTAVAPPLIRHAGGSK
jgi:hypothetical protein